MWVLGMEVAAPAGSFMSPPLSTLSWDEDGEEDTLLFFCTTWWRMRFSNQRPRKRGGEIPPNGLFPLLGFFKTSLNIKKG